MMATIEKKIDKLIVPFAFFLLCAVLGSNILKLILPAVSAVRIKNFFLAPIPSPVWFLLCLFWDNIIYCWIVRNVKTGIGELTFVIASLVSLKKC